MMNYRRPYRTSLSLPRPHWIVLLVVLVALTGCRSERDGAIDDREAGFDSASFDTTVVARIDGAPVYMGEVMRSYGLRPVWERGQTRLEAFQRQLDQVVDDRLLSLEARNVRLDASDVVAHYLRFIEDREVNRALYREDILGQIDVSEETLLRAYALAKRRVILDYVRTTDPDRAAAYAELMHSVPIDSLSVHAEDDAGTTDWLSFGDLTETLDGAFTLEEHEVLGPVRESGRLTVVRLRRGEIDRFMSEWEFAEQKNRLRRRIQERAAAPLAAQYVADLMADKAVRLDQQGFEALAGFVEDYLLPGEPELRLDDERVETIRASLPLRGDETVVRFAGGEMTALDVLRGLSAMPSTLIRTGRPVQPQLRDAIAVLVRNQFIAESGRGRGLDSRPHVQREIRYFTDQYLAGQLRLHARRSIDVPSDRIAEIRNAADDVSAVATERYSDEQLDDFYRSYTLARWETDLVTRLRTRHHVEIFEDVLAAAVRQPSSRIDYDPVPLIIRDIFH
jgi:hypothetical protein